MEAAIRVLRGGRLAIKPRVRKGRAADVVHRALCALDAKSSSIPYNALLEQARVCAKNGEEPSLNTLRREVRRVIDSLGERAPVVESATA